jgi:hypothetical protein
MKDIEDDFKETTQALKYYLTGRLVRKNSTGSHFMTGGTEMDLYEVHEYIGNSAKVSLRKCFDENGIQFAHQN